MPKRSTFDKLLDRSQPPMVLLFALSNEQVVLSFAELLNGLLEGHEAVSKRSTFNRLLGRAQQPATEERKS